MSSNSGSVREKPTPELSNEHGGQATAGTSQKAATNTNVARRRTTLAEVSAKRRFAARIATQLTARRRARRQIFNELACWECGKVFKNKRTLKSHRSEVHIGVACIWEGCRLVFRTEAEHNRHLQQHNREAADGQTNTCQWPGCGKTFSMDESAARHLRRHVTATKREALR